VEAKLMEKLTVKEISAAIREGKAVLVPLGVTEQHGHHLPLSTDSHNAYQFARGASEKTGALVAPTLHYAFSGGTLPGTINVSPPVVSLLITEILASLAQQGFKKIVLVLGHGGTESERAVRDGVDYFLRKRLPDKSVTVALFCFWKVSSLVGKAFAEGDFHAGYLETSLMLYWHPELVRKPVLDRPEVVEMLRKDQDAYQIKERPVEDEAVFPYISQNPRIEVGVMGFPEKASAEFGREVCAEVVEALVSLIRKL